ncbi:hypothetical protein [Streptomyces sp. NPDC056796]|uniref:hypothetical protein n=1 Tax=Streptomyces sp. NPDC056796 TaxID=3345947 RepID=UPI0036B2FECD
MASDDTVTGKAQESDGSGTGTYKVDEAEIDRVAALLNGVVETLGKQPSRQTLQYFAGQGGVGDYTHIHAGSGRGVTGSQALQDKFKKFATDLEKQLTDMETNIRGLVVDLLLAKQYMKGGELTAALTAEQMMADLQDALADFGGTNRATTPGTRV